MLDNTYLKKLKKDLHAYALIRRDVIAKSGDALHHAKRSIFALHRNDPKEAAAKLAESKKTLTSLVKKYKKTSQITGEGAYKAALEEYVEAHLFSEFLKTGKMKKITGMVIADDVFLAGLCDVPGELYRYAVRMATEGNTEKVAECVQAGGEIIGVLMEFDLTKYLRTKFDQAKKAVQKLEIIQYELALRGK